MNVIQFDREEWLATSRYGYTPEEVKGVFHRAILCDRDWHDQWTYNMDTNMLQVRGGQYLDTLFGKYNGPVCVCGAGPSFPKNIDKVRELNIPVITVDRSLIDCQQNGIKPVLTLSVDAQSMVMYFFRGVKLKPDDNIGLCYTSSPDTWNIVRDGNLLWFGALNPFSPFWTMARRKYGNEIATLRTGSTVTFSAIDAALYMGFNPIITIGNEMCYEKSEDMAEETWYEQEGLPEGRVTSCWFRMAAEALRFFPKNYPEIDFWDMSNGIGDAFQRMDIDMVKHRLQERKVS